MTRTIAGLLLLSSAPALARAQQTKAIPVVALPAASARSTVPLATVMGIHELADGKVLVNDAGHHQLKVFDSTLTTVIVVVDSTAGSANSYGCCRVPLIPFRGDSSLFPDASTQSFLVLDGSGRVIRAIAPLNVRDFGTFIGQFSGVDPRGRLVYRGPTVAPPPRPDGTRPPPSDSVAILRADLEQRRIDTIARIKVRDGGTIVTDRSDPAVAKMIQTVNPVPVLDDWSLTSDGRVALVRGHDYHIDWVEMDGKTSASPKMPFDWRRMTDDDKQKIIDSATAARAALDARLGVSPGAAGRGSGGGGGGGAVAVRGVSGGGGGDTTTRVPLKVTVNYYPLKDITDFYPPLRRNGLMPDLDGNLWILPTTTAQSQGGELVYDVVNSKGELFERVRLPAGRSLAGFGKNGTVYLLVVDQPTTRIGPTFYLERTRLVAPR